MTRRLSQEENYIIMAGGLFIGDNDPCIARVNSLVLLHLGLDLYGDITAGRYPFDDGTFAD